jgi:hypothetical protein
MVQILPSAVLTRKASGVAFARRGEKVGILSVYQPLAGKRVAVFEDNVIVRMGIELTVTDAGGSLVKTSKEYCGVAVLDMHLDRDQTILATALSFDRRGTPLLFYTSCSEEEIEALQRHFVESLVLRKPATHGNLLRDSARARWLARTEW